MKEHGFNALAKMHPTLVTDHLHSQLAKFYHPAPVNFKYVTFKNVSL